ncbi:hypothetical protein BDY19DRAFT_999104 [Irpex rosettiformis]|uniref:Uncharacterized protein n=1 Tax=Irpex rosettiformis TaxID=378272 RepID=A0ACB8TLJ7_9APHY|nr:hypothetical protein BDY19DRAFT_999104 [Irpex rosettiformis]
MSSAAGSSSSRFQSVSNPLLRALSPLAVADAQASVSAIDGDSFLKIDDQKASALGLARSLDDVLRTVTVDYQTVLVPQLRKVFDYAERRATLRDQLVSLEKHKATGTFPTSLASVKVPVLQLGKEYLSACSPKPPQFLEIESLVSQTRAKCLDHMLEALRGELAWYEVQLSVETLIPQLATMVDQRFQDHIVPNSRVPEWDTIYLPNGKVESKLKENSWAISPSLKTAHGRQRAVIPRLIYTILALVENRREIAKQKVEEKKKLKDSLDVEMADAQDPNEVVRKELESLRKQLNSLSVSKEKGKQKERKSTSTTSKKQKGHANSNATASSKKPSGPSSDSTRQKVKKATLSKAKRDRKGKGRAN